MGSTDEIVATAALVVALIAMLITTTQLIAQIIATAEGARKCSGSVLGPWYNSTRPNTQTVWKKNWREGRLETRFTVPEISLTTSAIWINHVLYDPNIQKSMKDEWIRNGEWWEDQVFPSTKIVKRSISPSRVRPEKDKDAYDRDPIGLVRWFYWLLRPSRKPPPADCLLGGSSELDSLLFHQDYDNRAPDRVGWINFLAFLRVEMELSANFQVIQQRWWDQYPAKPAKISGNGGDEGRPTRKVIAPNAISWPKIRYVQHSWTLCLLMSSNH